MKYFPFLFLVLPFVLFACTQKEPQADGTTERVAVNVPTIQCGTCKDNIEHALDALEGVTKADVNVKAKIATVEFIPAKLTLGDIETEITKAGYDANGKKADPAAYEKLDECCKLP